MSNTVPDSDLLKAKYAEIAALKRAIDEKKSHNYQESKGSRGIASYRIKKPYRHQNLTYIANPGVTTNGNSTDSSNNTNKLSNSGYISTFTSGGRSIMSVEQFEKDTKLKEAYQQEMKQKSMERRRYQKRLSLIQKNMQETEANDRVRIDGQVYAVTNYGSKLILLSIPEPWKFEGSVKWNNYNYTRSENGNLSRVIRGHIKASPCRFFTKTGSNCPYLHDDSLIRLCRSVVKGYTCVNPRCMLSHEGNQFNTQVCKYFLEGKCHNHKCMFSHHKPNNFDTPNIRISVCRPFAQLGMCERGKVCPFLHLFRCPDFEERGICPRGRLCSLEHIVTKEVQQAMVNVGKQDATDNESSNSVVVVDNDDKDKIKVISSFTVEPSALFLRPNDKYDIYIDTAPKEDVKSEFMITLSDSEDELEENEDYVELEAHHSELEE